MSVVIMKRQIVVSSSRFQHISGLHSWCETQFMPNTSCCTGLRKLSRFFQSKNARQFATQVNTKTLLMVFIMFAWTNAFAESCVVKVEIVNQSEKDAVVILSLHSNDLQIDDYNSLSLGILSVAKLKNEETGTAHFGVICGFSEDSSDHLVSYSVKGTTKFHSVKYKNGLKVFIK